jgi:tRNA pseudouridine55 synthase
MPIISSTVEGLLLINKSVSHSSFRLVSAARKRFNVKKIGHAGTLDPFASGVMILLVGRNYTKLSNLFLNQTKSYQGRILLGKATDTFDCEGTITSTSEHIPSLSDIESVIEEFQGTISQIPPMYSAKKINGQRLYKLARQGIEVERAPVILEVETTVISYEYPHLDIEVSCSKGTYIRSIAHDIGQKLGCGGHLTSLIRTRCGPYTLSECCSDEDLFDPSNPLPPLITHENLPQ